MANNKLLLALDVDGVHLDSKQSQEASGCWIGCRQQWIETYLQAQQVAENYDCELVFAIVTAKSFVDDLLLEQIEAFESFLKIDHSANFRDRTPSVWNLWSDGRFCAIRNWQQTQAEGFESDIKFYRYDDNTNEHFGVDSTYTTTPNIEALIPLKQRALDNYKQLPDYVRKSGAIKRIAKAHDIPTKYCILVDDTPIVLQEAQQEGINIVDLSSLNTGKDSTFQASFDDTLIACQNLVISTVSQVVQQHKSSLSNSDAEGPLDVNSSSSSISTISISGTSSSPSVLGKRSYEEGLLPSQSGPDSMKRSTP